MLERIKDSNIRLIYLAIFLLGIGYGVALGLVSIFLDLHHYTKSDIGSLAAWFALGIVSLALPMGYLIRRFSARNTLITALAGYAFAVAVFPFLPGFFSIAAVRFFDGACSAGIWVSCETILLSRSDAQNKAFVNSLYAISMAVGYVLGPLIAKLIVAFEPTMVAAFLVAGGFAITSSLVVFLRLDPDVPEEGVAPAEAATSLETAAPYRALEPAAPSEPTGYGALLWKVKTSCFATFVYGYFQASLVLFLPLYLIEAKGIARERTILVPAFFAVGMLLFSNYGARLGDRFGHLLLMRVLATIGTTMVVGFVFLESYTLMCMAVFIAGATLASISPVSLALQGVIVERRDYSRANAIYNVFYAAGMLLGPPVSSRIYNHVNGVVMLYHLAALWAAFVAFSVVFFRDDPAATRARIDTDSAASMPRPAAPKS